MVKRTSILQRDQLRRPNNSRPLHKAGKGKLKRQQTAARSEAPAAVVSWDCGSTVSRQAAAILRKVLDADAVATGGATIKSLTLAPAIRAKKATHAVVCETLKHLELLKLVVTATDLLARNPKLTEQAAYVLLYDLLLGQGLKPQGPAEQALLANRAALAAQLEVSRLALQDQHTPSVGVGQPWPRYARVNLLKTTVAEALSWLRHPPQPWQHLAGDVRQDDLLPDVLIFPAGTELHACPLVQAGHLILQGRASCMAAHALRPEPDWTVMDACAAPGNKTSHLAGLMQGQGRLLALDLDAGRCARLRGNLKAAGADRVVVRNADFLSLNMADPEFSNVQAALVDAPCSGSGTTHSRLDHLLPSSACNSQQAPPDARQTRLRRLAAFQTRLLRHAMQMPALRRLVYSTCSVHAEENEAVVAAVLPEAQRLGFRLEKALPAWPCRGLPLLNNAECLLRTRPEEHLTDGFFVALFVKPC